MALLRFKRRPHEDPAEALLLACKKQKTDESFSSLFKFAATVQEEDKDKDIHTHVNTAKEAFSSQEYKDSLYKKRQVADITDKLRNENKLFSENNRLKVINLFRQGVEGSQAEKELTVIDVENASSPKITSEEPKDSRSLEVKPLSTNEQYVYDLYYSHEGAFDEIQAEHMLSAHAVDDIMFDFSQPEENEEIFVDDEDDSNDENNWRNDYPEEISDDSSIDDEHYHLAKQMKNINLSGEYGSEDLSSDEEDEKLPYGDDYQRTSYFCSSFSEESEEDG